MSRDGNSSVSERTRLTRRNFLKTVGTATVFGALCALPSPQPTWAKPGEFATLIDLTKCDGCQQEKMPRCVEACRVLNEKRFPVPQKPIKNLWPQKSHDDWSDRKDVISTLTPYNWITVQHIDVNGEKIFIPRRCMHCDNPPCARLCPFGALNKFNDGAVVINAHLCLGGAKCKAVCPWFIPQRQSGVGIYLKLQPIPAGGGVMYKCDLCHDLIQKGGVPACVEACEKRLGTERPLFFGHRNDMVKMAHERATEIGGFIYGEKENGGTATLYVSKIPFEDINRKILESSSVPHMGKTRNRLDEVNRWFSGFVISPLLLAAGSVVLALRERKKSRKDNT